MPISGPKRRYNERTAVITVDERKRRASAHGIAVSFDEKVKLLRVSQMRRAIFDVIRPGSRNDSLGNRAYDTFIIVVATLSLLPLMFRTEGSVLSVIEHVSVYILFADYILRWLTADLRGGAEGMGPFVRYPFMPIALCQLIGILPTLGVFPATWGYLRVLRIAVSFYYLDDLFSIGRIVRNEKRSLLSVLGLVAAYIFVSALVLYACEPDTFGNFFDAIYWSVTTFSSVGYGDYYPHGAIGKAVTTISMFISILVIAVPTGLVTAGYMYEIRKMREQGEYYVRPRPLRDIIATFREEGGIRVYFSEHRALVRYLSVMALCLAVDVVLVTVAQLTDIPLWLDTIGTALASSMLESAAGIVVGLGSSIYLAIISGDPQQLLYYVVPAATAVAYGLAFQRGKPLTVIKMVRVVLVVVVIATCWDLALSYLLYEGVPTGAGESILYSMLARSTMPDLASKLISIFVIEAIDKVLTALFVILFYLVLPDKWREIALPPISNRGPDFFREGWFVR